MTSDGFERILAVLHTYLAPTAARIVLAACAEPLQVRRETITEAQLCQVAKALIPATRHFVKPEDREAIANALRGLCGHDELEKRKIPLVEENDLSVARLTAKQLCDALGARSLQAQKAATAVSELARNIINYAKRGTIELIPSRGPPSRLQVIATDSGAGIKNLSEVLSGRYKSKTGMGLGLLGVKRMADRFHVDTGPTGTRVEFEILT